MTMDWPLIGAVSGLAASAVVVGVSTVALVRSGQPEVQKAPTPPILWSARRSDVSPDLQVFPGTSTSGTAAVAPARQRPAPEYQLYPPEPVATSASTSATPLGLKPRRPPIDSVVAKAAVGPEQRKTVIASAPATTSPATPKPQIHAPAHVEPPKIVDRRYEGVLTMAEIARLKSSLRLTADQEPHWRPVEAQLRQISRLQMAQVESGRKAEVPQSSFQQLYYAARPLLDVMRPDQKERVRGLARSMGYGSVASMI
jgi:hypothetical protein